MQRKNRLCCWRHQRHGLLERTSVTCGLAGRRAERDRGSQSEVPMPVYHVGHLDPLALGVRNELVLVEVARKVHASTLKFGEELSWSNTVRIADPLALEVLHESLVIEIGRHAPSAVPELIKELLGLEGLVGRRSGRHEKPGHAGRNKPACDPLHGTLPVFAPLAKGI